MTIKELKEAFAEFPDDMEVRYEEHDPDREADVRIEKVEEICPTPGIGAAHNYLLLS